jgi:NAD(P)-dependent dehydrogenase (short-subunit alcohol dehydrogenase family)
MARLAGLTALVTGGGRGIGAATARRFAQEGARVAIMGKGEASLAEMKARCAAEALKIETILGDVTNTEDVKRAVGEANRRLGRIDILVNNAGASHPRPFEERTAEEMIQTLNTNLVSVYLCCQAVAPLMLEQGSGRINQRHLGARARPVAGREGVMDYSAAKAGVVNLTKDAGQAARPDDHGQRRRARPHQYRHPARPAAGGARPHAGRHLSRPLRRAGRHRLGHPVHGLP